MREQRVRGALSAICNIAAVILTVISVASFFTFGGDGNMEVMGASCFRYFTVDSNILAALASLCMLYFNIKNIIKRDDKYPVCAVIIKLVGTAAVTVTLLTVVFFLGPTMGYKAMFTGCNLYMHLITPLLMIISFCFFERDVRVGMRITTLGMLPTVIYGIIYAVMVLIIKDNHAWNDFYGFNRGGMWPVYMAVMFGASYLISAGLSIIHNKFIRK